MTHNRGTWREDFEPELTAILKSLPLDELHLARRLIRREITRRALETDKTTMDEAERALFHV